MARPPKGITSITITEAVKAFMIASKQSFDGKAPDESVAPDGADADEPKKKTRDGGSVANKRVVMRAFEDCLGGERKVHTLSCGDFDDTMAWMIAGAGPIEAMTRREQNRKPRTGRKSTSSQGSARSTMRQFATYCHRHRWLSPEVTLLEPIFVPVRDTVDENPKTEFKRFTLDEWAAILDEADRIHARARIAVALGFYAARRVSDILRLTWGDVDFIEGTLHFVNKKGNRHGSMPLYDELRDELLRWHDWVVRHYGEPQPDWWLVPARATAKQIRGVNSRMMLLRDSRNHPLDMHGQSSLDSVRRDVRNILAVFGYGSNQGTGTHTWRRSAARELQRAFGMKVAQVVLDHKHSRTTRQYTGDEQEKEEAFAILRGGALRPKVLPDNVTELRPRIVQGDRRYVR